jgi:hypothetical protein
MNARKPQAYHLVCGNCGNSFFTHNSGSQRCDPCNEKIKRDDEPSREFENDTTRRAPPAFIVREKRGYASFGIHSATSRSAVPSTPLPHSSTPTN